MKTTALVCSAVVFCLNTAAADALGGDNRQILVESLVGNYEGVIQVDKPNSVSHYYSTEIVAIDTHNNTVSLIAYCADCAVKEFNKKNCNITEVNEVLKFNCKQQKTAEEYTFDGNTLSATGFGNNYPYSINMSKIVK